MPTRQVLVDLIGILPAQLARRDARETINQRRHRQFERVVHEQVHVVGLDVKFAWLRAKVGAGVDHEVFAAGEHLGGQQGAPVLGDTHQVYVQCVDRATAAVQVEFCSGRRG